MSKELPSISIAGKVLWRIIESNAYLVKNSEDEDKFIHWLRHFIKNFYCSTCRPDAIMLIQTNNPESYKGIRDENGRLISMLYYTWVIHTLVSDRIKKPPYSIDDLFIKWYSGQEMIDYHDSLMPDIRIVGPVIWREIESYASSVENDRDEEYFIHWLHNLMRNFYIKSFGIRSLEIIKNNNYKKYKQIRRDNHLVGMLMYVCMIHNIVNNELGKPNYPFEKVYESWYKERDKFCSKKCVT